MEFKSKKVMPKLYKSYQARVDCTLLVSCSQEGCHGTKEGTKEIYENFLTRPKEFYLGVETARRCFHCHRGN